VQVIAPTSLLGAVSAVFITAAGSNSLFGTLAHSAHTKAAEPAFAD
jgi:hypothetical protein